MLYGRRDLVDLLPATPGDRIVELGAGTGRNVEFFGTRLAQLEQVEVVDICPALLNVARRRFAGMPNVQVVQDDATRYLPAHPADAV